MKAARDSLMVPTGTQLKKAPLAELDLFHRRLTFLQTLQGENPDILRSLRDTVFSVSYQPHFYAVDFPREFINQRPLPETLSSGEAVWRWRRLGEGAPSQAVICKIGDIPRTWHDLANADLPELRKLHCLLEAWADCQNFDIKEDTWILNAALDSMRAWALFPRWAEERLWTETEIMARSEALKRPPELFRGRRDRIAWRDVESPIKGLPFSTEQLRLVVHYEDSRGWDRVNFPELTWGKFERRSLAAVKKQLDEYRSRLLALYMDLGFPERRKRQEIEYSILARFHAYPEKTAADIAEEILHDRRKAPNVITAIKRTAGQLGFHHRPFRRPGRPRKNKS
jgi:hypothetical protein